MDLNTGNCVCDQVNNFTLAPQAQICMCVEGLYLSPNGVCEEIPLCPESGSGCAVCSNSTDPLDPNNTLYQCDSCIADEHFFLSSPHCLCEETFYFDGDSCKSCTDESPACVNCVSGSVCLECNMNFTLVEGKCECMPQFYLHSSDTCLACTVGCLSCTNESSCILCDTENDFELVGGYCHCKKGQFVDVATYGEVCMPCASMPGCVDCNMEGCIDCDPILGFSLDGTTCACDYGYFIGQMGVCTQCSLEGCLHCDAANSCLVCENSTYYLSSETQTCLEVCGDGLLFNLECDDGNTEDGDGCSSECKIEDNFTCSGGSASTPSACSYSGSVLFNLTSFVKSKVANQVVVKAKLEPVIPLFNKIDYENSIVPNFPVSSRKTVYDPETGFITFTFDY